MAKKYRPIPIPLSQKWREFRVRALPVLIFFIILGGVAYLWQDRINSPDFMGKVIADSARVSSPADGIVEQLYISNYDRVEKGEPIAKIIRADSTYIQAKLDLVNYQIESMESGFEPIQNLQRNTIDYENLKLDKVQTQIELASLRIQLNQRNLEYNRARELFESGSISEEEFQRIETEYQLLESDVEQKEQLIQQLDKSLENLQPYMDGSDMESPMLTAIRAQEQELAVIEEELKPVTVYSPIKGVISQLYKHNGEYVRAGEQLFDIESTDPSYIAGYIRQPLLVTPEPGMEIQIRTRKPSRNMFNTHIMRVGGHIKLIEPNLQRPGAFQETGLPVQIAISEEEKENLMPGEIVDITMDVRNDARSIN